MRFSKSSEELDKKYNSSISIEGLTIPGRKLWFSTPGCMNYELRGQHLPSENVIADFEMGKLYGFDPSKSKFYNKISLQWNAYIFSCCTCNSWAGDNVSGNLLFLLFKPRVLEEPTQEFTEIHCMGSKIPSFQQPFLFKGSLISFGCGGSSSRCKL